MMSRAKILLFSNKNVSKNYKNLMLSQFVNLQICRSNGEIVSEGNDLNQNVLLIAILMVH